MYCSNMMNQEETKLYVIRTLQKKAEEEGAYRFNLTEIKRDARFPPLSIIFTYFNVKRFDEILRAAQLWPQHPTKDELIISLRRFYIQNGRSPRQVDACEGRLPYHLRRYVGDFDGWNNAIREAGLPVYTPRGAGAGIRLDIWDDVSDDELIWYLKDTFADIGFLPAANTYKVGDYKYPHGLYLRRFGSWKIVAELAGLRTALEEQALKMAAKLDDMLLYLMVRYEDTKVLPTSADYAASNPKYSLGAYCRHFGGWKQVADLIGYTIATRSKEERPGWSNDDLLLYLMVRYEDTGILPYMREYRQSNPKYSLELYVKRFGSWKNVAKLTGLVLKSSLTKTSTNGTKKAPPDSLLEVA